MATFNLYFKTRLKVFIKKNFVLVSLELLVILFADGLRSDREALSR